jgi:hypothetical protein
VTSPGKLPVVVEVPPTAFDEFGVVIQSEAIADTRKLIQAVQHLRALRGARAGGAPQHAGRKFMNRGDEPVAVTPVPGAIVGLLTGRRHGRTPAYTLNLNSTTSPSRMV